MEWDHKTIALLCAFVHKGPAIIMNRTLLRSQVLYRTRSPTLIPVSWCSQPWFGIASAASDSNAKKSTPLHVNPSRFSTCSCRREDCGGDVFKRQTPAIFQRGLHLL